MMKRITLLILKIFFIYTLKAQQPLPINLLKLKATHNSYACCGHSSFLGIESGNSCPVINTPPPEQIDDYGVWGLELDFDMKSGVLTIGHDGGSGKDNTWSEDSWGITVQEYLNRIKNTRAFKEKYRPIFIRFGKKCWGDSNQRIPTNDLNNWFQKLKTTIIDIFGKENIFGRYEQAQKGWLTLKDLGGKVIPYVGIEYEKCPMNVPEFIDDILFWNDPVERVLLADGDNKSPTLRNNAIRSISPLYTLISQDLHQNDWTFEGTAPPNPLYVVQNAPISYNIKNIYGDKCGDGTDQIDIFTVHQQGTFKLPFDTVQKAVNKITEEYAGWTVLVKTGNYNEKITITKPLTLKADGGTVIIGK